MTEVDSHASHGTGTAQQQQQGGRSVIEIWEQTYRLKPSPAEKFVPRSVENIIRTCMDKKLSKEKKYNDAKCKEMALELCTEIKDKVKDLNLPRYKVVLQSVIGETQGQGAYISSRCLWDTEVDSYASYSFKNNVLFCTLMVFGLYLE